MKLQDFCTDLCDITSVSLMRVDKNSVPRSRGHTLTDASVAVMW